MGEVSVPGAREFPYLVVHHDGSRDAGGMEKLRAKWAYFPAPCPVLGREVHPEDRKEFFRAQACGRPAAVVVRIRASPCKLTKPHWLPVLLEFEPTPSGALVIVLVGVVRKVSTHRMVVPPLEVCDVCARCKHLREGVN